MTTMQRNAADAAILRELAAKTMNDSAFALNTNDLPGAAKRLRDALGYVERLMQATPGTQPNEFSGYSINAVNAQHSGDEFAGYDSKANPRHWQRWPDRRRLRQLRHERNQQGGLSRLFQQGKKQAMTDKTTTKWKPGTTGNPKGRPPGKSEITRLRASLAGDVPGILAGLVLAAKQGDMQAARLILERVLPALKPVEQAVPLRLPDGGTLTAKASAVLAAAGAGELAPTQAAQLITALGSLAKITEIDELAARIAALEEQHGKT